jgi:mRNA-degrading endonuclease RelE of RelBE toxin-antitoxin system
MMPTGTLMVSPRAIERPLLPRFEEQLQHQPTVVTRNRKPLRDNLLAEWELRVQKYRVLYNVDDKIVTVSVVAIARKEGNRYIIDTKEYPL